MNKVTASKVPEPRQRRSQDALERTLKAVEELLGERHFEDIRVQDIVRRAGTSVGSFYQRFGAKEALLPYLFARHLRAQAEGVAAAMADPRLAALPLAARVKALVVGAVRGLRARRGLYRALFVRGVVRPDELSGDERALQEAAIAGVARWLLERRAEISHPEPDTAVRFAAVAMYSAMDLHVLFDDVPGRALPDLDDEAFAAEVERLVLGYLTGAPPRPAARPPRRRS